MLFHNWQGNIHIRQHLTNAFDEVMQILWKQMPNISNPKCVRIRYLSWVDNLILRKIVKWYYNWIIYDEKYNNT